MRRALLVAVAAAAMLTGLFAATSAQAQTTHSSSTSVSISTIRGELAQLPAGTARPAQALTACSATGASCYYQNGSCTGGVFGDTSGVAHFSQYTYNGTSTALNNSVSSAKIAAFKYDTFYDGDGLTGSTKVLVGGNGGTPACQAMGTFNDLASSTRIIDQ